MIPTSFLGKSLKHRNKRSRKVSHVVTDTRRISHTIKPRLFRQPPPQKYTPAYKPEHLLPFHGSVKLDRKVRCKEKVARADRARKVQFFKRKARGGSSRPMHRERHNRSC